MHNNPMNIGFPRTRRSVSGCCAALLGLCMMSGQALAEDEARWLLQTSVYTTHFKSDPQHNNNQKLLNLEYQRPDRWVIGAAGFDSSFGQNSQYVYVGKLWRPFESQPLVHLKLTGGLIHGYKGEYQNKIPMNSHGVAPAIIPSIGLSGKHLSAEVIVFGNAGLLVALGVLF